MSEEISERTSVLIVGAGPVGLALAIELGQRGIECVILERNERVGNAPRAKTTHVRTREHFRRWGISNELAAASPLGIDYPSDVVFVTRLAGYRLARFTNAFNCAPARNELYSEHAQWIPQYTLEQVLRAHAQRLPSVKIKFGCEFLAARETTDSVTSRYLDQQHKGEVSISSRFLVGADGSRSAVRAVMGARMQGTSGLSRNYNFVFHAPGLAQAHSHGPAIMYWQVNAQLPSLIGPMDAGDTWFFMPTRLPDGVKLTAADAASAIQQATGLERDFDILRCDEWTASKLIADRYRSDRIFLAGDACHLHPPFGGYGMNMGIADAVDLGWKLSAVLQGWGGPRLLDSYTLERRPTHELVIAEAVANHSALADTFWAAGLESPTAEGARQRAGVGARILEAKAREFHNLGCVLGYRYEASPVILADGSVPPAFDSARYIPSAHPGCVAPHGWLSDSLSLYDTFGTGFTLLTGQGADAAEIHEAQSEASAAGVPLEHVAILDERLHELYEKPYSLIRPDQHVAWRGDARPDAAVLDVVTGRAPSRRDSAPEQCTG